ncbi:TetR/AcrR family transcriptional regulator [Saccharopolyspora rosea]|uniref:TetR/AcrR family transcriptional regulator n=1 Tax=Saccharopolyspora rosea TaxID=524884 RepID=UPI0021D8B1FA|nr:TetR/AcrR family transcriptional regulator [Saccharopolyspora rosea]
MTRDRDELLRSAAEFLGRRPNATQDEIAKAVGVSRATLHRHFAGRGELLAALESLAVEQLREALDAAELDRGPAEEALHRLVAACEPVSDYLALLYSQSQELDPDRSLAAWEDIDDRIAALFRRGQQTGEFRPDLSALWLTDAFSSLVAGAAWVVRAGRAPARDFPRMIVGLLLHGVARTSERSA